MDKFNISENKKTSLLGLLLKIDKRKYHDLYLCSCYFNAYSIIDLINGIKIKKVKLSQVFLYIDRREALASGKAVLDEIEKRAIDNNIDLTINIVNEGILFHTKAYALIANGGDKYSGSLVIGSANLTKSGLTNNTKGRGNIESLLDTQDENILSDFIEQTQNLKSILKDDLNIFDSSETLEFKLALLKQGYFVHRWSDNLNQPFAVRYRLNEKGRRSISNADSTIKKMAFDVDSASISKNYFKFDFMPRDDEKMKSLIKNYGIETYIGYWIPKIIYDELAGGSIFEESFDKFVENLTEQWDKQKEEIKEPIDGEFKRLLDEEFLDLEIAKQNKNKYDPYKLLLQRIEGAGGGAPSDYSSENENNTDGLLKNKNKLRRIFLRVTEKELPFDISDSKNISDIYNEIIYTIESKKRKNKAMLAFLAAVDSSDISLIIDRKKIEKQLKYNSN